MLNFITDRAAEKKTTVATYIDLSKAFDCLQYDKLFHKLSVLGFDDQTVNWFKNYLSERKQVIDLEGTISTYEDMQLGVPQGSILGPILFLIYVNDINQADTRVNFTKFADDTTILTSGHTHLEAVATMNESLERVHLWFQRNKLNLNPSKTRYMIFNSKTEETQLVKINNQYIERVWDKGNEKAFKLMGIWVDEKLKWQHHIDSIGKKMSYATYGLAKASKELSSKNKKLLYSGLIHSHLVFGLPLWGFALKGRLNSLKVKQKRAIRKIFNLKYRDHTNGYFAKSSILKLDDLIEHTTLCYIQSGLAENSPYHVRELWKIKSQNRENLRNNGLRLQYAASNRQWVNDLAPVRQAKLWNACKLEKDIKPSIFKVNSKVHYLSDYILEEYNKKQLEKNEDKESK